MTRPYAEVIGDPIAHSKSPLIHNFWLAKLGIDAEYRATHIRSEDLASYLAQRRRDAGWCGCNITMPHKQSAMAMVDEVSSKANDVGAINTVISTGKLLVGQNTDVDGVGAALANRVSIQARVTLIGAGGAARAALSFLKQPNVARVGVLVRDIGTAERLREVASPLDHLKLEFYEFADAPKAMAGSNIVINASPLGSKGFSKMPTAVLQGLDHVARNAIVFDMVYNPSETQLLSWAHQRRLPTSDGYAMLIGQADAAFGFFFGSSPPREHDAELRELLMA